MTAIGTRTSVLHLTGARRRQWLHDVLDGGRALLVATPSALRRVGLGGPLPADAATFCGFTPNPTTAQAMDAARARARHGADVVVGIGGGSAMDVAKAARALPADPSAAGDVLARRDRPAEDGARLVLVPTTAGSGSEVTSFATLYEGHRKLSLDDDRVRADEAGIDPELLVTCPADVLWSGALDTVAHAIESLWSTRSTAASRERATAALERIAPVLTEPALAAGPGGRDALSRAGTLAGEAIDRTRTTAAHALAYPLTAHLGLAHGYAVAVTLRWLVSVVATAPPEAVRDPRGPRAPGDAVAAAAAALGVPDASGIGAVLDAVLARCRPPRTTRDRIDALVEQLVDEGLASERVDGMPVELPRGQVRDALRRSLGELVGNGGGRA